MALPVRGLSGVAARNGGHGEAPGQGVGGVSAIAELQPVAIGPLGNTGAVLPIEPNRDARRRERFRRRRGVGRLGWSPALESCGAEPAGADVAVKVLDGVAHVSGVKTCGLVWACPVCGPKIRHGRSLDIGAALRRAEGLGWGVAMLTLTVRHRRGEALVSLMRRQERAWRALQQSRAWRDSAAAVGLVGMITAREVTYGEHGWHPHRHVAIITRRVMGRHELEAWGDGVGRQWLHQLGRQGLTAIQRYGVDVRPVSGTGLARYLEKVEGPAMGLPDPAALELVRGDLKSARSGGVTPEELAEMVCDGEAEAVRLWLEFAGATAGRRMVTWTVGLRIALAIEEDEATDEELAALDVGGQVLAMVACRSWWTLVGGGLVVELLEAAERGRDHLAAFLGLELGGGWWLVEDG